MIEAALVDEIAKQVEAQGLDEQTVTALRKAWPDIHFTYCSDDDVGEMPAAKEANGFNIYLIDSSEHCLKFTRDLENATGLVLAEVEEDDS